MFVLFLWWTVMYIIQSNLSSFQSTFNRFYFYKQTFLFCWHYRVNFYFGPLNLPKKRMLLVGLCLMKNRKGWSAMNCSSRAMHSAIITTVAAAASVPSSLTSTKALCATEDTKRPPPLLMPVRSAALALNKELMPMLFSIPSKEYCSSSLNFGKWTLISVHLSIFSWFVHSSSLSTVSSLSSY